MPKVSARSIEAYLQKFAQSAYGQNLMKSKVAQYKKDGVKQSAGGSAIVDEKAMVAAAQKMIELLQETAKSHAVPASVLKHFDKLRHTQVKTAPDGSAYIGIYFADDLHRASLYPETYEAGVHNIVALFNNGYEARNYVYGWWDDHKAIGSESVYRSFPAQNDAYVRSKRSREGLGFIGSAVREFNAYYGTTLRAQAVANEIYTK